MSFIGGAVQRSTFGCIACCEGPFYSILLCMCRMIGIHFSFRSFFVIQFMLAEMRHIQYLMTCMCAFTLEHTNTCKQSPNNFIQLTHPAWRVSLIVYTHQVDTPSRKDTQQESVTLTPVDGSGATRPLMLV